MSNNIDAGEEFSWIKEAVDKKFIKFYDYQHFSNIQEIGSGAFGKVYRANWKELEQYFALKSFFDLNNSTVKEIDHEVITLDILFIMELELILIRKRHLNYIRKLQSLKTV